MMVELQMLIQILDMNVKVGKTKSSMIITRLIKNKRVTNIRILYRNSLKKITLTMVAKFNRKKIKVRFRISLAILATKREKWKNIKMRAKIIRTHRLSSISRSKPNNIRKFNYNNNSKTTRQKRWPNRIRHLCRKPAACHLEKRKNLRN